MSAAAGTPRISFLVGAGRSGTTLLYKLLCLHPDIAYISNYENRYTWLPGGIASKFTARRMEAKLNAWFNSGNAYFVKRPWAKKIFPTPNEGEPVYAACGLPSHTDPDSWPDAQTERALRQRFAGIQARSRAPVFLTKRTANNRRIPMLDSMFPDASYIHLIRDGREVAHSLSTVEWWDTHQVWWDGRTPLQMESAGEERLTVCARNWVREMDALQTSLAGIDPSRTLELRFEQLLSDPLTTLECALVYLGLEMTPEYARAIESLNMHEQEPKWRKIWDESQLGSVVAEEQQWLTQLGYVTPEVSA